MIDRFLRHGTFVRSFNTAGPCDPVRHYMLPPESRLPALAREVTFDMEVRPPVPITADHIETAKERLILARQTHLDSLVSKLAEPRVRRVIEPVLAATMPPKVDNVYQDDIAYVHDLDLIAPGNPVRIANPIYRGLSPELKVWRDKQAGPLASGLAQLDGYLDRFRLGTGTLVIFGNREKAAPIHERTAITQAHSPSGRTSTLLRA